MVIVYGWKAYSKLIIIKIGTMILKPANILRAFKGEHFFFAKIGFLRSILMQQLNKLYCHGCIKIDTCARRGVSSFPIFMQNFEIRTYHDYSIK